MRRVGSKMASQPPACTCKVCVAVRQLAVEHPRAIVSARLEGECVRAWVNGKEVKLG